MSTFFLFIQFNISLCVCCCSFFILNGLNNWVLASLHFFSPSFHIKWKKCQLRNCWFWFILLTVAKKKLKSKPLLNQQRENLSFVYDVLMFNVCCICSHSQLGILQLPNRKLRVMSLIRCCSSQKTVQFRGKNQRNYLFCCGQLLHCYPAGYDSFFPHYW